MITNIKLTNFKGHTNTSITLGNITVLAGKNGAGKTSVLQALHYVSQLKAEKCTEVFRVGTESSPENVVKRGAKNVNISASSTLKDDRWFVSIEITTTQQGGWDIEISDSWMDEPIHTISKEMAWPSSSSLAAAGAARAALASAALASVVSASAFPSSDLPSSVQNAIPDAVHLKMTAKKLAQPSVPENISPEVEYDGYGLASAIAYLQNAEPDSFDKLLESVKEILPFVRRIRVLKKKIQTTEQKTITVDGNSSSLPLQREEIADELYLDLKGAKSLPAHALSEGTLLTLGLLTVLVSPACPNLLLLDDIEQGLHPKAQRDILKVIRKLAEGRPSLQIVMTTHSPYVIDEMAASDVWLLNADNEETIHAMQLSSHPDSEQALQLLTTGEFWGTVGEEWVAGQ